jgi:short-subunit dehydrogenase
MEEMIELNVTALTRLTYAAAPGFAARGYGTIINIASTVGISPETLNGVYGATKAYVIALTQSLHKELSGKGVRIQAVVPGVTATDFWRRVGLPYEQLPRETVMAPEAMVDAALAGLDLGETITIPALQNADEWNTYEALRQDLAKHLSLANPAPRYVHAG